MHPIERLRYVARASGVPQAILVREAAGALASFSHEPHGLVTACRRMVARQPRSAPLVWLASNVLAAPNAMKELRRCIAALEADPTPTELRYGLPDGARVLVLGWPDIISDALVRRGDVEPFVVDVFSEGSALVQHLWNSDVEAYDVPVTSTAAAVAEVDLVLLESPAIGTTEALVASGCWAAAAVAHHRGTPVWLVGGVGRALPAPLFGSLQKRVVGDEPWDADDEFMPLDLVTHIVGPTGVEATAGALQSVDVVIAPELLREAI